VPVALRAGGGRQPVGPRPELFRVDIHQALGADVVAGPGGEVEAAGAEEAGA
jgi:hypothetical protein